MRVRGGRNRWGLPIENGCGEIPDAFVQAAENAVDEEILRLPKTMNERALRQHFVSKEVKPDMLQPE